MKALRGLRIETIGGHVPVTGCVYILTILGIRVWRSRSLACAAVPAADLAPCRRFTTCRGFDGLDQLKRRQVSQAMLALADGDRAAFDTVYDEVWPVILKFSARMIGDQHMAEDIAQQTLLKVFSRVSTFDRSKDALNWTLGIAANECRTYLRKTKHTSALTVGLDDASELASAALTPQEQVEKG